MIPPQSFIPLAEANGLILPLGEWVLRRSCRDAAQWAPGYKVAVNLSSVQLSHANLPELVERILRESGLPPDRLELELTETAVARDKTRSLRFIQEIKALGVTVALDDFGTGYSSLDTLRTFPFDKIKLDRSFVGDLGNDRRARAIIRAVLALARSLGIPVLAEGIETPQQNRATRCRASCSGGRCRSTSSPPRAARRPSREVARPRWSLTCASTARGGRHADGRLRLSAWPQVCRSH